MVTKKDFKAITKIIGKRIKLNQGTRRTPKFLYADDLVSDLADYFAEQNPRFNRQKFLNACRL